ncbi:polysaccharide deacetylase family protein [Entomohabitans teleogrylli]|uniref:polysaccharide deacetylase family protein n=1 Tax=Entomohabitans teleogrylli TaxID=1384589 RepID=UPI00073D895E|nr:polysaccharide deacetylase family protein [Entomohabitans teleogrylli]
MGIRLIVCLLLFFAASVHASLLREQREAPRYMQTTQTSVLLAQVGNRVITVGTINEGQILAVTSVASDYSEFSFGFGTGFIEKNHLQAVQGKLRVEDRLGDLNKPFSNRNLVTFRDVPLYEAPDARSNRFGTLAGNLRYPVLSTLRDRLNQTWFQVRIGGRLAWISSLDAREDQGIPVLTYHHILRDEENSRFRQTSTTTSVRAFSNQMTWLRDQGYATLTLYQLEGYLRNQMNLPARAVVITFDDGLKSVSRYAYPILRDYGFNATAFIISSRIKRHPQKWDPTSLQFMSIAELKAIQDVFDIQSHTHFLHRLGAGRHPVLLSRSYHNILFDFERSRRALAQFNPHVWYLSYPFGGYDDKALRAARDAGFRMAVTTVRGKVKPGDNPFLLKRLYILRTDSLETMAGLVSH